MNVLMMSEFINVMDFPFKSLNIQTGNVCAKKKKEKSTVAKEYLVLYYVNNILIMGNFIIHKLKYCLKI